MGNPAKPAILRNILMETASDIILNFDSLKIGFKSGKRVKVLLPELKASSAKGELIAVIGRNGIGKSTLLRTLAGLQNAIDGNLNIDGISIKNYSKIKLSEKVGYISTEIVRVSNMKVYDLVSLGRFPYTNWFGKINEMNHAAVLDAIAKAGIMYLSDRKLTELSDGERQRAMIAMVLAQDAAIMVMDEPTAFLDISSRFEMLHLMQELTRKRKKTIVYSTHDFNSAINLADKIWLMSQNGLLEGAPEDIMIKGSFKTLFDEAKVRFNERDATFSVRNDFYGYINLKGEGKKKYWTEKALLRAGFLVEKHDSETTVESPSGISKVWKCYSGNDSAEFESIYELITWLLKMKVIS
jgi:iron complex transport system ATP-binding protein